MKEQRVGEFGELIIGHKRDDCVYIPVGVNLRLLVTGEVFEVGGRITNEPQFRRIVQQAVVDAMRSVRERTYRTVDGEIAIAVVAVAEPEPAAAR